MQAVLSTPRRRGDNPGFIYLWVENKEHGTTILACPWLVISLVLARVVEYYGDGDTRGSNLMGSTQESQRRIWLLLI
ncbi:hypothetical protein O6P43_017777 [Quillaja saponaria]|uniref:Uncharacterized protein n=1 Tax=Quillaja saponaria TaxID=32244 RepID=A0AAD7LQX9_QUISA|nr:hypothetical protein O6P43_017777 [Quillaja saponaria]